MGSLVPPIRDRPVLAHFKSSPHCENAKHRNVVVLRVPVVVVQPAAAGDAPERDGAAVRNLPCALPTAQAAATARVDCGQDTAAARCGYKLVPSAVVLTRTAKLLHPIGEAGSWRVSFVPVDARRTFSRRRSRSRLPRRREEL